MTMHAPALSPQPAIERLAAALRLRRHQICMRAGSLNAAERLAGQWEAGEVSLDDVRRRLERAA